MMEPSMPVDRRSSMAYLLRFAALSLIAATLCGILPSTAAAQAGSPANGEPILLGVSRPLTGQNAQYGAQWKAGFDLALDEINAQRGTRRRPLQDAFNDTTSNPRQSVA